MAFTWCLLVGVGMSLCTTSCYLIIGQYFSKRRAFATSIGSSGASVIMLFIPILSRYLLEHFGFSVSDWGKPAVFHDVIRPLIATFNVIAKCGRIIRNVYQYQ